MTPEPDPTQLHGWTVAQALREQARRDPEAVFLLGVGGADDLRYGEALRRAELLARCLVAHGIGRGDRVTIMSPNSESAVIAWLAIALCAATDAWINPALRGDSLQHALETSAPRIVFAAGSCLAQLADAGYAADGGIVLLDEGTAPAGDVVVTMSEFLRHPAPVEALEAPAFHDIAAIIYTSGTTGLPKGAMLPHAQAYLEALTTVRQFDLTAADVFLVVHPMYHIAGKYMAMLSCILAGCRVVLTERFEAGSWLELIRAHGVTATISHGPMTELIFQTERRADDHDNTLRRMSSAPFPVGIADRFAERFDVHVMELWGMTEVDNPIWQPKTERHRPGSCGKVCAEWFEVRIADPVTDLPVPVGEPGEILVRARLPFTIFQGYLGRPEVTAETFRNGWFHSGDFARMDGDGYVYFVDRSSERIRRRAENISSAEIEAVAQRIPEIALAAAVAVPSGLSGDDDVKLCVIPRADAVVDEERLLAHLLRDLPPSHVPRYVEVMTEFPRTPATGKIQKALLRYLDDDRVWDRRAAGVDMRALAGSDGRV